jgi:hypothetical protein
VGIWLSAAANVLALGAGAVFLLAEPGARFRGTEPEARAFSILLLLATALGLLAGLPASVYDLWRRRWLWGAVGVLLALSPWPLALSVSELVAMQKGLIFD